MKLTVELRNIIEKHLELLEMAYKTLTVKGATSVVRQELHKVYVELGYRPQNINCNVCIIQYFLTLYSVYLEDQKEASEDILKHTEDVKIEEIIVNIEKEKEGPKTQKKGRPKKTK